MQWWDTHVYRTHLRSPSSRPNSARLGTPSGLSPRSRRALLSSAGSMRGFLDSAGSFPPYEDGAQTPGGYMYQAEL